MCGRVLCPLALLVIVCALRPAMLCGRSSTNNDVTDLTAKVSRLQGSVDTLHNQIRQNCRTCPTSDDHGDAAALATKLSTIQGSVTTLRSSVSTLQASVQTLQNQIQQNCRTCSTNGNHDDGAALAALAARVSRLQYSVERHGEQLTNHERKLTEQQQKLVQQEGAIRSIRNGGSAGTLSIGFNFVCLAR